MNYKQLIREYRRHVQNLPSVKTIQRGKAYNGLKPYNGGNNTVKIIENNTKEWNGYNTLSETHTMGKHYIYKI